MAGAAPHTEAANRARVENASRIMFAKTMARWREEHREFAERSKRRQDRIAEVSAVFALDHADARMLCIHFDKEALRRHDDLKEHVRLVLAERRLSCPGSSLASAEAFRAAIAALPVGRDIRARLAELLDAHIATLRQEAR